MENNTKGAGDDYPIIPQTLDYKCADCGADMNEGEAATFTVCDKCWEAHYKSLRSDYKTPVEKELASLKEVVKELIPIAERMKSACESGETLCFDNEYDLRDATEYQKVIDRAKRISDNK